MSDESLLLARVPLDALDGTDLAFLVSGNAPFVAVDPVDLDDSLLVTVFEMYVETYSKLDPKLNIGDRYALLDYTRWVLFIDENDHEVGFVLLKATDWGAKLCALATDGSNRAKQAIKKLLRKVFDLDGVYAEVSDAVETIVRDHAPLVPASFAEKVLSPKRIRPKPDGYHYRRQITGVGAKTKLMVGKPRE